MESIDIKLEIPEAFSKDCEAYGISEAEILQMFICHVYTLCAIAGGNKSSLIAKTTRVFTDFVKTAPLDPVKEPRKKGILLSVTKTIVGMTMTKDVPWSSKAYCELIGKAYRELSVINNSNV